jgi:hypothetical protein
MAVQTGAAQIITGGGVLYPLTFDTFAYNPASWTTSDNIHFQPPADGSYVVSYTVFAQGSLATAGTQSMDFEVYSLVNDVNQDPIGTSFAINDVAGTSDSDSYSCTLTTNFISTLSTSDSISFAGYNDLDATRYVLLQNPNGGKQYFNAIRIG